MKEINKLVHLITHGLKSNFDVIDLSGSAEHPGKEQQLYNGVLEGRYKDDDITAEGMYNSDIYDQRFRMLKSRLRYKLYDLIYHLDFETPQYSFKIQRKLECKEYLHKAAILYELGEFDMAEKQYNKVLVLGNDCQFTTELIEAMELRRKVLAKEFKPTDFEQTITHLKDLRAKKLIEDEAEDLFLRTELLLSKSIHSRNISGPETEDNVSKMEALYEETQSFEIFEYMYHLKIWLFSLNGDFEELIEHLKKSQKQVQSLQVNQELFDSNFNELMIAKSYLSLDQYENGLKVIKDSYKKIDKSTTAWFSHAELHYLLAMHNKSYDEANKVLNLVLKNPNTSRVEDEISNRWKLFKLYLNFAAPHLGIQKRIRFNDIYQASESYFKESKGYKVSLYLIEFLHALNKEGINAAEEKLDSLESFFFKELNDPGKNGREKQLFKMLTTLRKSGYQVEDTLSKTTLYEQRLTEKKLQNAFADFEIIPYEHMWNMICTVVSTSEQDVASN